MGRKKTSNPAESFFKSQGPSIIFLSNFRGYDCLLSWLRIFSSNRKNLKITGLLHLGQLLVAYQSLSIRPLPYYLSDLTIYHLLRHFHHPASIVMESCHSHWLFGGSPWWAPCTLTHIIKYAKMTKPWLLVNPGHLFGLFMQLAALWSEVIFSFRQRATFLLLVNNCSFTAYRFFFLILTINLFLIQENFVLC